MTLREKANIEIAMKLETELQPTIAELWACSGPSAEMTAQATVVWLRRQQVGATAMQLDTDVWGVLALNPTMETT